MLASGRRLTLLLLAEPALGVAATDAADGPATVMLADDAVRLLAPLV